MSLVAPLFDGPIDIIGDIHGEISILDELLVHLGYSNDGYHPENRRLVFMGDLVDRGPDSPAVTEKVMLLVENGVAQCVMGNHELSIVRNTVAPGNEWIVDRHTPERYSHTITHASDDRCEAYHRFFESMPLALENDALRVVHACWHQPAINQLSAEASAQPISILYTHYQKEVLESLKKDPVYATYEEEAKHFHSSLSHSEWIPQKLPAHTLREIKQQMDNPFYVLTFSEVHEAEMPYFAGGRWRMTDRTPWWNHYNDSKPVVIGHFWRQYDNRAKRILGNIGKDVFEGIDSHAWMGKNMNVYCVDYSVGQLHIERSYAKVDYHGRLAALRYPEWEVHHNDGVVIPIGVPGNVVNQI